MFQKTLVIFLSLQILSNCPQGFVTQYKDTTMECLACPENCQICYLEQNDNFICAFCKDGYFFNQSSQKCEICQENCGYCEGKKINQCQYLKPGYFYSMKNKKITQCPQEGCSHCEDENICTSCLEGYFVSERKFDKGSNQVTCQSCEIPNCKFCRGKTGEIKNSSYIECALCEKGYGLNNGKCVLCPENCQHCDSSNSCKICEKGFQLGKDNLICQKITIENCFSMQQNEDKCKVCDIHYFLSDDKCKSCLEKIPNCAYCKTNSENDSTCMNCKVGYYIHENKCEQCGEHCNHCNDKQCLNCSKGYFYNKKKTQCEKCPFDRCFICEQDKCLSCHQGYYFDEKKKNCLKCKNNCLNCTQDGEQCLSCPITLYTFHQQIKVAEKQQQSMPDNPLGFLGMILKGFFEVSSFKTITKCVKDCNKLGVENVIVDQARRQCFVKKGNMNTTSPILDSHGKQSNDVYQNLINLKVKYMEEINRINQETEKKIQKNFVSENQEDCNFNGKLKKIIKGNQNSYYECICDEGFQGDNCDISDHIFDVAQRSLIQNLDILQKQLLGTKNQQRMLFNSLIQASKFKVGRQVIEKMKQILKIAVSQNQEIDNEKELYVIYDSLLLNFYDLLEDEKKLKNDFLETDTDLQQERKYIYQDVLEVIQMIENSMESMKFNHSFLQEDQQYFMNFDTFSYNMAEYKYKDMIKKDTFFVGNPNIDTSVQIDEHSQLQFNFSRSIELTKLKINIQIINFSAFLFRDKLSFLPGNLVSNVIYLKNIKPGHISLISNQEIGLQSVKIIFPFFYVPIYDEIEPHVNCISFSLDSEDYQEGTVGKFDEDKQRLDCTFKDIDFKVKGQHTPLESEIQCQTEKLRVQGDNQNYSGAYVATFGSEQFQLDNNQLIAKIEIPNTNEEYPYMKLITNCNQNNLVEIFILHYNDLVAEKKIQYISSMVEFTTKKKFSGMVNIMNYKGLQSTTLELVNSLEPTSLDKYDIKIHNTTKLCEVSRGLQFDLPLNYYLGVSLTQNIELVENLVVLNEDNNEQFAKAYYVLDIDRKLNCIFFNRTDLFKLNIFETPKINNNPYPQTISFQLTYQKDEIMHVEIKHQQSSTITFCQKEIPNVDGIEYFHIQYEINLENQVKHLHSKLSTTKKYFSKQFFDIAIVSYIFENVQFQKDQQYECYINFQYDQIQGEKVITGKIIFSEQGQKQDIEDDVQPMEVDNIIEKIIPVEQDQIDNHDYDYFGDITFKDVCSSLITQCIIDPLKEAGRYAIGVISQYQSQIFQNYFSQQKNHVDEIMDRRILRKSFVERKSAVYEKRMQPIKLSGYAKQNLGMKRFTQKRMQRIKNQEQLKMNSYESSSELDLDSSEFVNNDERVPMTKNIKKIKAKVPQKQIRVQEPFKLRPKQIVKGFDEIESDKIKKPDYYQHIITVTSHLKEKQELLEQLNQEWIIQMNEQNVQFFNTQNQYGIQCNVLERLQQLLNDQGKTLESIPFIQIQFFHKYFITENEYSLYNQKAEWVFQEKENMFTFNIQQKFEKKMAFILSLLLLLDKNQICYADIVKTKQNIDVIQFVLTDKMYQYSVSHQVSVQQQGIISYQMKNYKQNINVNCQTSFENMNENTVFNIFIYNTQGQQQLQKKTMINQEVFLTSYVQIMKLQYVLAQNLVCFFDKGNLLYKNMVTIRVFDNHQLFRYTTLYFFNNRITLLSFVNTQYPQYLQKEMQINPAEIKDINTQYFQTISRINEENKITFTGYVKHGYVQQLPLKIYKNEQDAMEKFNMKLSMTNKGDFLFLNLYKQENQYGIYNFIMAYNEGFMKIIIKGVNPQYEDSLEIDLSGKNFINSFLQKHSLIIQYAEPNQINKFLQQDLSFQQSIGFILKLQLEQPTIFTLQQFSYNNNKFVITLSKYQSNLIQLIQQYIFIIYVRRN